MCLAVPARVTAVLGPDRAKVELDGVLKEVSTALVENVRVGEYLIVHVGFALGRIDEAEAARTLALMAEARGRSAPEEAVT
jgi:hydrogenase expression/formation protein HypC